MRAWLPLLLAAPALLLCPLSSTAWGATACPAGEFMNAFAQPPSSCSFITGGSIGPLGSRVLLGTVSAGNAIQIPLGNEFIFTNNPVTNTLHVTPSLPAAFGAL